MENKGKINELGASKKEIDFKWVLLNILLYWKWFLVSVILCLTLGFLYLRYSTPIYNVDATIILKDSKRGGLGNSELSVFQSMGLLTSDNNIDNEVEILCSRNLLEGVVKEMGLYTRYSVKGRLKETEIYGSENFTYRTTPVTVTIDPKDLEKLAAPIELEIARLSDNSVQVTGTYGSKELNETFKSLPAALKTPVGMLTLTPSRTVMLDEDMPLYVRIITPLTASAYYMANLKVKSVSRDASVVGLDLRETHRQRGVDFLNHLINMYNRDAMEDKNKASSNAASFIDERLMFINENLAESESDIESFKSSNRLTNMASESQMFLYEDNASEKELVKIGTQLELLSYLEKELGKTSHKDELLPATLDISSSDLAVAVNKYNAAVLEKERLLSYSSEKSPVIIRLQDEISSLRQDISNGVSGARRSLQAQKKEITSENRRYGNQISNVPRLEREYTEKVRQQKIKENLYIVLLEKREEAHLSLAVTVPSAKVIEDPLAGGGPIAPNRMIIMLIAFVLGLVIPIVIIVLKELFNYKIESDMDVKRLSPIPLLASLPLDKNKTPLVVNAQSITPIAEMFRLLRTNVQFALGSSDKKVILVTSSVSGEGKTFVSINLALTFALRYKTLVIGLDIRRPKLADYMKLSQKQGIVTYLCGETQDVDSIIQPSGIHPNLDVIPAGPIPPNPNELLMDATLEKLFTELRGRYDYIIVDTSPVGSVSDGFLLDRVSDVSLFVLRSGVTSKSSIGFVNGVQTSQRLKKLNLVLNGLLDPKIGSKYGSGYGSSGYGYGYGYSYSEKKEKKAKG